MAKRRLTKQQKQRIDKKRTLASSRSEALEFDSENQSGLVITSFGKRVLIEDEQFQQFSCAVRQGLGKLVAGDEVIWQKIANTNERVVTQLIPRRHELSRPGFRGQKRMVASNIDIIGIVAPVVPGIHTDMIDRYLVATAQLDLSCVLIINKIDLLANQEEWNMVLALLDPYLKMGLEIIPASTQTQDGLDELKAFMSNKTSVFVGPSGAGKSSLINALIPDLDIRVGALSESTGLGKHTTSNSILYRLPESSNQSQAILIDSPGVRQFSPTPCTVNELAQFYPDFMPFLGQCKYNNCTHQHEPNCAIIAAVESDQIALSRYESFQRMLKDFQQLETH